MAEVKENIFLFVPNIIGELSEYLFIHINYNHFFNDLMFFVSGFARVVLALISFYFMPTHCVIACSCYVTSALLDAFDGHAARYFNQSTLMLLI